MNEQEIKIESGIPLPKRKSGYGVSVPDILKQMQPGDSVVIQKSRASYWRSAASRIKIRVAVRKISPTESRLWVV